MVKNSVNLHVTAVVCWNALELSHDWLMPEPQVSTIFFLRYGESGVLVEKSHCRGSTPDTPAMEEGTHLRFF